MAVKLLDERQQWGFIKSVFNSSARFFARNTQGRKYNYGSGIDPNTEQARFGMPKGIASAFTGKTYNQR